MKALFRTEDSLPLLIARLALGIVMLPHGMQKSLGLFGGEGFSATMGMFTSQGMPAPLAFLVILGESAGSLGLIVGFLSRIAGFGITCIMLGAIGIVHWQNGFFMNWSGKQAGEGFEYHILALGVALAVLVGGGGRASVDRAIAES
ncbi:MAG TPA: DoxX family protein [Candidatus Binatia bacterium]|nr:DoxX family protein [Candidatus Binatia bacterium]